MATESDNGSAAKAIDLADTGGTHREWPLWLEVGIPVLCVALFIVVNFLLYWTHSVPDDQEAVPLAGIAANASRKKQSEVADNALYGSTTKEPTDNMNPLVSDNMAMTVSMEETSFNAASRPVAGTSMDYLTPHAHADLHYDCSGASSSRSTEPLVTSGLTSGAAGLSDESGL